MTTARQAPKGRPWTGATLFAALVLLLGLAPGCSTSQISVYVDSSPETNEGRPLYMVVRAVEASKFATDTYESISRSVFARPADDTIIRADVIYPGAEREVIVEKPVDVPLSIYFLFTDPGDRWKTRVLQPVPDDVEILLGENEIAGQS
jgi:hypothetical protein